MKIRTEEQDGPSLGDGHREVYVLQRVNRDLKRRGRQKLFSGNRKLIFSLFQCSDSTNSHSWS